MDGSISAFAEANATQGAGIPLDLTSSLLPYREHESLSIKVERLPLRARLSKGRNNGDNSWSLAPDELDGLLYLPPAELDSPHSLIIRVISLDSDSATTLVQFDVPILPGEGVSTAVPNADGQQDMQAGAEIVALEAELTATSEELRRLQQEADEMAVRHGEALQQQAADAEARLAEMLERQLTDARASWEAEQQDHGTEATARLERANEARLSQELGRQLNDARAAWEIEQQDRITIAVQAAVDHARAEARTEALSDARAELEQINEARLSQELGRRLADAKSSWEAEQQNSLAAAVQEAVRRAEQDTTARLEQTNEARLSQELGRRLADARASWEAEQQITIAATVQDAVGRAEQNVRAELERINDARLFEELGRRLADARALWDTEQKADIAASVHDAVQQANALARTELEQAQKEWRDASAEELAQLTARCEQAEAALDESHRQALPQQDAERELRELRDELASAQASIQAGESALSDTRLELDSATAEISRLVAEVQSSTTQSYREAELEFRLNELLAETEATLKENRAAWNREREEILANSEEIAQQRVDQAFEQWQQETQAALSKAQQEWVDSEATRLAVAEAHWRKSIGIVKSRGAITGLTEKRRQRRINGRLLRWGAIAACLVAAIFTYPLLEPIVTDHWWPRIAAQKDIIEPSIRKAGTEIQSLLSDVTSPAEEPRALVGVAAANVRANPSISAPVIATLPRGSEVTPIDRRGSWVQIRIGGTTDRSGWLHGSLLKDTPRR